jgi:carbamoylphosphate synthase large subunit
MSRPLYTSFRPRIRSRHPSHSILRPARKVLPLFPFKSVIRLGSTTEISDTNTMGGKRVEVNTVKAIKNSSNKLLMKQAFTDNEVITADWFKIGMLSPDSFHDAELSVYGGKVGEHLAPENLALDDENISFPIISKSLYGSRNKGNKKHDTLEELITWLEGKDLSNYIFEKYYNYTREYRLHVTSEGCFYTCRKMLKRDTPDKDKWYRNDAHCVWIMEENESFDKPSNWDVIVEQSVKALNAVGLDIGAVDLKIQSATNADGDTREDPKFVVIEINSAPSFGTVTEEKYIEILPQILNRKYKLI